MSSTIPGPALSPIFCPQRATGMVVPVVSSPMRSASSFAAMGPTPGIATAQWRVSPYWQERARGLIEVPSIRTLVNLDSHLDGANSLYENIAYHLLEAALSTGNAHALSALTQVIESRPSLEDLFAFASESGFSRFYELYGYGESGNSPQSVLEAFLKTVAVKQARPDLRLGLRSLDYDLGAEHIRDVFNRASEDPHLRHRVEEALLISARSPLPFLRINRLFHLLMNHDSEYKIAELVDWNHGLTTAFLDAPFLTEDPRELHHRYQERLLRSLDRKEVVVSVEDEPAFMDVLRRKSGKPEFERGLVEATYEMPGRFVSKPTIHLLDLRRIWPAEDSRRIQKRMRAYRVHEFVHICQRLQNGPSWMRSHQLEAEMEAFTVDGVDLLEGGDDVFHRVMRGLSPYGPLMGQRHFIEKLYFRP